MIQILAADAGQPVVRGPFRLRRIRPGAILGPDAAPAFGPFSVMDHANLAVGTLVKMHEHSNDEILSYLWRGTMVHEDSHGHREALTPRRIMMMNAGESFWHEESVPDEPVEMLQIFIRPREAGLEGRVQFFSRPETPADTWVLIAGPAGSDAPLEIRQTVWVYDSVLSSGTTIELPELRGLSPWLYVMDGDVRLGDHMMGKGEAATFSGDDVPAIQVKTESTIVLFLMDATSSGSLSGTISGR